MNASIRGVDKQGIDRRMMFHMVVHAMDTSKELYVNTLSFKVLSKMSDAVICIRCRWNVQVAEHLFISRLPMKTCNPGL